MAYTNEHYVCCSCLILHPAISFPPFAVRLGAASARVGYLCSGESAFVLAGPVCDAKTGWLYWQVETAEGVNGWTTEGNQGEYWLAPLAEEDK
jgi:hypothetical protein